MEAEELKKEVLLFHQKMRISDERFALLQEQMRSLQEQVQRSATCGETDNCSQVQLGQRDGAKTSVTYPCEARQEPEPTAPPSFEDILGNSLPPCKTGERSARDRQGSLK